MHIKEVINPKGVAMSCDCSNVYFVFSDMSCFNFRMVEMRGSGFGSDGQDRPGLTDDQIREIIAAEVAAAGLSAMSEMFGSIKIGMIKLLYD